MNRRIVFLCSLALAVRVWVVFRTAMPERDAAHYLWMADGLAFGEPERLFQTVFHPVFPALIGALRVVWPGLDAVVAGQLVGVVASALAVWPLYRLTLHLFGERAATAAAVCFALGTWFVRHPVDVLSEGVFHLVVAGAVGLSLGAVRGRSGPAFGAGLCAALAYGVRPEGATLGVVGVVWLALARLPRAAAACAAGAALALVFPLGWATLGEGFTLSSKAAFVWRDGVGGGSGGGHYLEQLVRLPGAFLESLGFVVGPAAVVGAVIAVRGLRGREAWLLLAPFLVQLAVVPALRAHPRFLSGYAILLLPFAGLAWAQLWPALARRRLVLPAILATFAVDLVRLPQARRTDRVVERTLGAWIGGQLGPGERIVSDAQRLEYFAGVEPGPPRAVAAAEREAAARDPRVRFVVWIPRRTPLSADRLREMGFAPVPVPAEPRAGAAGRGFVVFGR